MRRQSHRWILIVVASLAVATGVHFFQQYMEYVKMHAMPSGLRTFDVKGAIPLCGRWKDTMPKTRDQAAYKIYIGARNLWRSKIEWQLTRAEALGILRDVQEAAHQGDWGARALMAYFYRSGLGPLESNHVLDPDADKSVEIVWSAVAAGQAWGFYDLGVAHEYGYGGAAQDAHLAWAYFLRAAELGSPEAQMTLASAYLKKQRDDAEEAMVQCAYKQRHGAAAEKLGTYAALRKNFGPALDYYQAGTKFGTMLSAVAMRQFFEKEHWDVLDKDVRNALSELGVMPDPERARRYNLLSSALDVNPDLRFTRLDQVMPLPPRNYQPGTASRMPLRRNQTARRPIEASFGD